MWITKKDFSKKKRTILTVVFGIWFLFIIVAGNSNNDALKADDSTSPATEVSKNEETNVDKGNKKKEDTNKEEEDLPGIPIKNDFEKSVWKVVDTNKGELVSIETVDLEDSDEISVIAAVSCENNEDTVNSIINGVKDITLNNDSKVSTIITFGDIKKGEKAPVLLMTLIYSDGTTETSMESIDYNTAKNKWMRNQFSAWDGSHSDLKKLIVKNLNDEKSYKHIETNYIDIDSEERISTVNKILSDAGYKQRVEMDDLFITSNFSAKNAFGGTVKNTAYGIASYNNQTITLIGIE